MATNTSKKFRTPTCAVLMAAYNGDKWIEEQLYSILNQTDVQVSVFISVDLSTDRTPEIVEKLSEVDSRLKLLPYGERFGGAGPNFYRLIKDADVSSFDMVAFSDQDDVWLPDKLSTAWLKLTSGEYQAYSSDVIAFWDDGRQSVIKKSYPQKRYDHLFEAAGPGCTYAFSSQCFGQIKQFVTSNYEGCRKVSLHDWLVYAFCRESGMNWLIDNEPKMLYRQHDSNQIGTNDNLRAYVKRFASVRGHWYRSQVTAIVSLCSKLPVEVVTSRSFMIRNFYQLRRRPRDVCALFLLSLFGIF